MDGIGSSRPAPRSSCTTGRANQFVAGFIGSPSMNFLPGTARRNGALSVEVMGRDLPVGSESAAEDGQQVRFGIRPEHLEIADEGLPARISVVEPTGSETLLVLRAEETEIVAVLRDWHDFKPGETVHLKPRADRVHLFEGESGERL